MERLVEVSEQEVRIDFVLGSKCRATVRLRSLSSSSPVAFKVQTSSPHKFLVNPPTGLIPPLSHASFQIILKPQSLIPNSFPRSHSDRFLIKTSLAPPTSSLSPFSPPDLVNSWFNSKPYDLPSHDIKLKVAFVGPFLLRQAVAAGNIGAARNIIKRQRRILSELSNPESELLLKSATELGENSEDMVNLLAEAGLRVEAAREGHARGWSELHAAAAAAYDRAEEVVGLLARGGGGGAAVDGRDKEGRTALHLAASKGNLGCAKVLAGAGAEVDARSKDGRTALYRAAANGDRRMVEMLVEMGADPTVVSMDRGRTAIDVARDRGHKEVLEILQRGEAVLNAARRGDLNCLESLLEKDATMSYSDQYGLTALHIAAIKGHKDAAMLLVEFGAETEWEDGEGHTPLHLAVEGGSLETVEVLINRGANVNAKSRKGTTPLSIAKAMGYDDISHLLIERGASSSSSLISSSSSSYSSMLL